MRCTLGMPRLREIDLVDERRFETVWREHGASILRYCRFAMASPEAGEDAAAETFARFLQRGDSIPDDKVEAWLFTVARNLCRSHQRRASRWASIVPVLGAATETSVQDEHETGLAELLAPLSSGERLAVYLRVVEDRSFAEVARLTGKSEDASKKTVYRALTRLRAVVPQDRPIVTPRGGVEHE